MIEDRPLIYKYLRHDKKFPHVWCGGCGIGILLGSLIRAIDHLGYTKDEIVLVSGIGCSGRLPVYVDFNTLHTTHGRALTFATGVKLAKPELKVIVVMGDGDATAIGGNHFIHAARRNVDVTAIIVNNSIYGMTGGQYSPTTPYGQRATTATYGSVENSFNISQLAVCAGAVFVGPGHGLPHPAARPADRKGPAEERVQRGRSDQPVPDALRKTEQAGQSGGDDEVAAGQRRAGGEGEDPLPRGDGRQVRNRRPRGPGSPDVS